MSELAIDVVQVDEGGVTCVVRGDIDASTVTTFRSQLEDLLDEGHTRIRLEADRLSFLDSTGLRVLADLDRRCRDAGGGITVVRPTSEVRRVLEIADLDQHFSA